MKKTLLTAVLFSLSLICFSLSAFADSPSGGNASDNEEVSLHLGNSGNYDASNPEGEIGEGDEIGFFKKLFGVSVDGNEVTLSTLWDSLKTLFSNFWKSLTQPFIKLYVLLRDGLTMFYKGNEALSRLEHQMNNMLVYDSDAEGGIELQVEGIPLNQYFASIHYVVGDLVYYELYVVIMLGTFLFWGAIIFKIAALFRMVSNRLTQSTIIKGALNGGVVRQFLHKLFS